MNSYLIRPLILGVFAFPLLVAAQQGSEGRQEPAVAGGQGGVQGQVVVGTVGGTGQGTGSGGGAQGTGSGGSVMAPGVGHPTVAGLTGIPGQAGTGQVVLYSDPGNNFFSNVPINELSAKAYRRFHRRFPEVPTGEYWYKYEQGYQVSFTLDQHHEFAYYGPSGIFLYSLRYYDGKDLSRDMVQFVKRRFPDYKIDVVTEVNNGMNTFYMLQIMNPDNIKVVTVADGKIEVVKEMINGSANIGPAEAAR